MDCVISGQLMLPDAGARVRLAPGTMTIRNGAIATITEGQVHQHPDFGGPDALICPGFVDTHLHLPQCDSIGISGMELLEWLERVIFPAEARWEDTDYAGQMATRVATQLLSFGTTSVAAYATVHHKAAQAAIDALAAAGMGGHVGQVLMDQQAPLDLLRPGSESLKQAAALVARGRIIPAVTPRFAVSCSQALLAGAGELAKKTGWLVQTHLSETRAECELVSKLHSGLSYVEVYRRAGLLGARSVLGHGIWLDSADRAALHAAGAVVAHCPTANRFLGAGEMDRSAAAAAGIRLSLGSDVAGGPDRSMVRVARAMIETARQLGHTPPSPEECWWQITEGNAEVLGLGTGRLAVGELGDVLIVRPSTPWIQGPHPLSTLLYAWDERWLEVTLTAGAQSWCRK